MTAARPTPKPGLCPCCGQPYAFRVRVRLNHEMRLKLHYRCGRRGGYVYVHEIEYGAQNESAEADTEPAQ